MFLTADNTDGFRTGDYPCQTLNPWSIALLYEASQAGKIENSRTAAPFANLYPDQLRRRNGRIGGSRRSASWRP